MLYTAIDVENYKAKQMTMSKKYPQFDLFCCLTEKLFHNLSRSQTFYLHYRKTANMPFFLNFMQQASTGTWFLLKIIIYAQLLTFLHVLIGPTRSEADFNIVMDNFYQRYSWPMPDGCIVFFQVCAGSTIRKQVKTKEREHY